MLLARLGFMLIPVIVVCVAVSSVACSLYIGSSNSDYENR